MHRSVTVVLLVVLISLAACSEVQPTVETVPSATPPATPAPQPTPTPTTEVSTQEAVADACSKMDNSGSYDIVVTTTESNHEETLLTGVKISGEDFEVTWTMKGETEPYSQFRRIDGVDYLHDGLAWRLSEVPLNDLSAMYGSLSLPCPTATTGFEKVGTETLDGRETTRYTETAESLRKRSPWDEFVGIGRTPRLTDFWIDQSGQIVQHYQVIDVKENFTSRENPRLWVETIQSVFSDVGQANPVTAPTIP